MNHLSGDIRHAIHVLLRTPVVSAVAVLALALGIGVNTSSFTAVKALVMEPLPFPHLDRVMTLWETIPKLRAQRERVAPANFLDWRDQSRAFEQMAAYRCGDANLTGIDEPERVQACFVTPGFFPLLGLNPILGRTFLSEESEPAQDGVVVVSRGFWQQRLESAPDAVGKVISLSGRGYTVVGVVPEDFDYPLATEVWAPLAFSVEEKSQRASRSLTVLGRLKPRIPVAQARVEMESIARRLEQRYPQTNEARGVLVTPLRELTNTVADRFVLILMAAAMFVLLLACANVANLQLARATGRQKEFALRAALGASRFRIASELFVETILIGMLGGGVGLFLANANLAFTRSSFPPAVFRWMAGLKNMHIDAPVLVFTLVASLLTGVLCGLPAIWRLLRRTTFTSLNEILSEGGRGGGSGPSRTRLQSTLVIAEVALALVLLVGAGLMVTTFQRMFTLNAGFNPRNLLRAEVSLPALKYRDDAQIRTFYGQVLQGLETIPNVKAASATAYWGTPAALYLEGRPDLRPGEPRPNLQAVSARYLQAMEIPLLRGRSISEQDGSDSQRVVVLSESIARHYWPKGDPIGSRIKLGNVQSPWLTVIGVSGDTKNWFTGEPYLDAYLPYVQAPRHSMSLALRTTSDPMLAASALRAKVHEVDRYQPVYDIKSMEQILNEETSGVRVSATTMSMYAVIALLLAATGIYAVISYSVVQRTHEVGVRIALGASQAQVLKLTLLGALRLAGIGLAIGLPVALALTLLMSSALYNVVAIEWTMFAGITAVLATAALLAGYIPARRAAKVDPMDALRHD
jgi:putative ABC transport system permease protein